MSSSSVYFDFHQPSLGGFSTLSPQEEAAFSNMKMMMNMQQAKLNHLSSKLSQSNDNNELQTTQDNHPSSSISQLDFPRQQFPEKLYHMLELADAQGFGPSSNAVSWLPNGRAFAVRDEKVFMESIVPLFFKQTKMRSFARQLSHWGFKRLKADSYAYCHERFVRGSPEELGFMVRITVKSKSNANQKTPVDLPPKVSKRQLDQREGDCAQVSLGSLSGISSQSPFPMESLKSRQVSMEYNVPYPTSQYLVAEPSFKRRVSMQDDGELDSMLDQVGISRHDPIMLALNESRIKSKSNSMGTTCANQKKPADLPPKVNEVQLKQSEDDCVQISLGSLSDVRVSSQSPIPRGSLKSKRASIEADVPLSFSSVGYLPSQYLVAEPSFKRRVTMKCNDVPVGVLDDIGILALNEGVPRDEFAEFIDHMIHLL